jgi:hypothetical protein
VAEIATRERAIGMLIAESESIADVEAFERVGCGAEFADANAPALELVGVVAPIVVPGTVNGETDDEDVAVVFEDVAADEMLTGETLDIVGGSMADVVVLDAGAGVGVVGQGAPPVTDGGEAVVVGGAAGVDDGDAAVGEEAAVVTVVAEAVEVAVVADVAGAVGAVDAVEALLILARSLKHCSHLRPPMRFARLAAASLLSLLSYLARTSSASRVMTLSVRM